MKNVARVMVVTIAAVLLAPQVADAGLLGWLSRLSGPGPFWGLEARVALWCTGDDTRTRQEQQKEVGPRRVSAIGFIVPCAKAKLDKRHLTWYAVGGLSVAENNPLQYGDTGRQETSTAVRLVKLGTSLDYTLFPALDLGVGGGGFYFAGPRFKNFWIPYFEARATVRPLVALGFPKDKDRERLGWLLVSASRVFLHGTITGSDFGAPLDPLNETNEALWAFDASIDVVRLLKNFR